MVKDELLNPMILAINLIWLMLLLGVAVFYFIAMLQVYNLTSNKASVFLGAWYLNPGDYEAPEGRSCCRRGALCALVLTALIVLRGFFWGEFIGLMFKQLPR